MAMTALPGRPNLAPPERIKCELTLFEVERTDSVMTPSYVQSMGTV